MRLAIASFALGVWLLQRQAQLPGAAVLAALSLASAVPVTAFLRASGHRRKAGPGTPAFSPAAALRGLALACAFAAIGFTWAALWAHLRLSASLAPEWESRDVTITGVVAAMPQPFEGGVRFEFDTESAVPVQARVPGRILLAWHNGLSREEFQEVAPVRAGERWRFLVRLRRPHGQVNPTGLDYEAWLLERGIRATGSVRTGRGAAALRLDELVYRPGYLVERLRERVRERFWDALPGERYAGVLAALAIGDQKAIEHQDWDVFNRTGVNHLMSISGLHVTMVAGLAAALVMFGWRRVQALALRFAAQKAGAVAGLTAAFGYCVASGFAVPAQRTLYMVGVVAVALVAGRLSSPSRVLALALLVVLLLDPWAVLSAGLWLSFGAVALIFHVGSGRVERPHWLAQWGAMQWAVTIGLAPLLLVLFQQVSLTSPLANAVAIPLVSLVVTPLALVGAVLPVDAPLQLAHLLLEWLMRLLRLLALSEHAVWTQHAPRAWTLPLAIAGIAWLLLPRGFPARWVGAVLLIPMVSAAPALLPSGTVALTVFDVGQGLAVLVRTRTRALLYDAGPAWSPEADSGSRVLVPDLRARGLRSLDALVVSHDDTDHSGGALSVLRAVPAAVLYSSLPGFDPIVHAAPLRLPCADGVRWEWDDVAFEFLHPAMARYGDPGVSANNLSCVLRVAGAHGSVLLAGDLEWRGEAELLERRLQNLRASVLVVPHHGSGTSSTPEFVRAVSPRTAVFPVGHLNRFAHPRPEVAARYAQQGIGIIRTDESGAVEIALDEAGASVRGLRAIAPRYWHGR